MRWMEDLETLQPYDERSVVQRMGKDVRALFLDRELAADLSRLTFRCCAFCRCRLLGTSGRKLVTQWKCRKKECHSGGVALTISVRRSLSPLRALATHVLRHHRQMETVSRLVLTNQCPVCLAVYGRLIVIFCLLFVVGPVVIDLVTLVKCTFHSHSVALSAQLNLEVGQSFNCTWRSI